MQNPKQDDKMWNAPKRKSQITEWDKGKCFSLLRFMQQSRADIPKK